MKRILSVALITALFASTVFGETIGNLTRTNKLRATDIFPIVSTVGVAGGNSSVTWSNVTLNLFTNIVAGNNITLAINPSTQTLTIDTASPIAGSGAVITNNHQGTIGFGQAAGTVKLGILASNAGPVITLQNNKTDAYGAIDFYGSDGDFKGGVGYANTNAGNSNLRNTVYLLGFQRDLVLSTTAGRDLVLSSNGVLYANGLGVTNIAGSNIVGTIDAAQIAGNLSVDALTAGTLTVDGIVGTLTNNISGSAATVSSIASNYFSPWTPKHLNLYNVHAIRERLRDYKPLRILHIRDDAINSDDQLYQSLDTFLTLNGSDGFGSQPHISLYASAGATTSTASAANGDPWAGGLFYFANNSGITNAPLNASPLSVGVPTVNRVSFVYFQTNTGGTITILTNTAGGSIGTLATVDTTHERIADVPVLTPTPIAAFTSGGAGGWNTLGVYSFSVYAYKTVSATKIYSQNPLIISNTISAYPAGTDSFNLSLNWGAVSDADGYRIVITDADEGAAGNKYIDVTGATSVTLSQGSYLSGSTVTPKSTAAVAGNMKPVGVAFDFATVTNCIVTMRSSGTNVTTSIGMSTSTEQAKYSVAILGTGGGGWGIDTPYRTAMQSNTFREILKVGQYDMIFINDLGTPGQYLKRTKDMCDEVGILCDVVVTTGSYTASTSATAREDIFTNTVGAIVLDTYAMTYTTDNKLRTLLYTNRNTVLDGVHTSDNVKTNVIYEALNALGLNHKGFGIQYGYVPRIKAGVTNTFWIDPTTAFLMSFGSIANTAPTFDTPWAPAHGTRYVMAWAQPSSTRQVGAVLNPSQLEGKSNLKITQYWVTTNAQDLRVSARVYRSNPDTAQDGTSGQTDQSVVQTLATTNMFTTTTLVPFTTPFQIADHVNIVMGGGDSGVITNYVWWVRARIDAY